MNRLKKSGVFILLLIGARVEATEPNNTFATATVLPSGVLSVADELTPPSFPDTILGVRDHFGGVYASDDNGSPYGDGNASGLGFVPTNSGVIDFVVTGWPDFDFFGSHAESGFYEVFVDVYDFFGDPVDSFSEVRFLEPGVMHDFYYSDFEWINGNYDVYIDNTIGNFDVDFFTFTGLTPGAAFTAETLDPDENNIDTYLGWFDNSGLLIGEDDDGGGGPSGWLSLIEGVVPEDGTLTFAVTGYGDINFDGDHADTGTYELQLQLESAGLPGDFNQDNVVDAADYIAWRKGLHSEYTVDDYYTWATNYGQTAGAGGKAHAAVPEPAALVMLVLGGAARSLMRSKRTRR